MPTAENAILYYEAGQDPTGMTALTDQGDAKTFKSAANLWSARSGYAPSVKPNGLATGGAVSVAASGTSNKVDVAALTCYLAGVLTDVSASADETVLRGADTDVCRINSITVTSLGAIAVVSGTDGASFSETRGDDGGPPWIPTGSIEIAQVRLSAIGAAAVTSDEIKQVPGTHCERYDYPTWEVEYGDVENGILGYAGVVFNAAMDEIHSDDAGSTTATKLVYASYYEPEFAEVPDAYDFVPPANAHSVSSKQVYGRTKGSRSSSLNQGSFSVELGDGISDGLLRMMDEVLWFRFKQDRLNTPYILCQGALGVTTNFPAGENVSGTCTISAETEAVRVTG